MSTTPFRAGSRATSRGCGRCCSILPATPSNSPSKAASQSSSSPAAEPDPFERGAGDAERTDIAAPIERATWGLNILVAEDNEINALLAQSLLKRLGHRCAVAATGDAAIATWSSAQAAGAPFDLVLMDVHMPGSDGIAATRHLRTLEAEHGATRTPVIALTANALDEDRDACLSAGMDGFLTKPLDRERLAAALAAIAAAASLAA